MKFLTIYYWLLSSACCTLYTMYAWVCVCVCVCPVCPTKSHRMISSFLSRQPPSLFIYRDMYGYVHPWQCLRLIKSSNGELVVFILVKPLTWYLMRFSRLKILAPFSSKEKTPCSHQVTWMKKPENINWCWSKALQASVTYGKTEGSPTGRESFTIF